ncbi:MAG: hypothetical protein WBX18_11665, partial [Terracidiphilus sp.]
FSRLLFIFPARLSQFPSPRGTPPASCHESAPNLCTNRERRFWRGASLDYALGKKHNVVIEKAGVLTLVEIPVLEMADDRKQSYAEDNGARWGG